MTSSISKLVAAVVAAIALTAVGLGPTAEPAQAHYWDTCRAELEYRAEAAVGYDIVCHTDKLHDDHRISEVRLYSTGRPFTSAYIKHYHSPWARCQVTGTTARCAAPSKTLESVTVRAGLGGPLACGSRAASYLRVDATYDGVPWERLGTADYTMRDYERYGGQSPGPCFTASLDVMSAKPRKARVGERTCVRFDLFMGGVEPDDYWPPLSWEKILKGAKLKFAGKTTRRFSRPKDRFEAGYLAKICKRFSKPGRYTAKLTKPPTGDTYYFSGLKEKVKVRR